MTAFGFVIAALLYLLTVRVLERLMGGGKDGNKA
jgi:hypothetical protein